jgi:hypothetical protein
MLFMLYKCTTEKTGSQGGRKKPKGRKAKSLRFEEEEKEARGKTNQKLET